MLNYPMKINWTPFAYTQLELINRIGTVTSGFIVGQDIGKFKTIENLLPVNFDENTIDAVYSSIYERIGDKLLGVFIKDPLLLPTHCADWFIEDIVMKIAFPNPEFYLFSLDKALHPLRIIKEYQDYKEYIPDHSRSHHV